jgi:nicotinate phosphoribosyltransferase
MTASKYSYLGGFDASSNAQAGFKYGIPIVGTHAHSYVMSFETEADLGDNRYLDGGVDVLKKALEYRERLGWSNTELSEMYAFVAYACAFPNKFIALVDSYSTLNSGVKNFISVYSALYELGYNGKDGKSSYGVRLDSGDLAALSTASKALFKQAGEVLGFDLSHLVVFASNDINEGVLRKLNSTGHDVDSFGIGTNLVTCQA